VALAQAQPARLQARMPGLLASSTNASIAQRLQEATPLHCQGCGGLYRPSDASIRHKSCTPGSLKMSPWMPTPKA